MPDVVLVDAGPLAALIDRADASHEICTNIVPTLERFELVTTEAAVTEAAYLLGRARVLQGELQSLLALEWVRVESPLPAERTRIRELLEKYADLPMDYADATLVVLAERLRTARVFTLDRRDFSVYRVRGKRFELLP